MQGFGRWARRISLAVQLAVGMGCIGPAPASWAQAVSDNSAEIVLHFVHDALFAAFLPVNDLPNDPKTARLLAAARDGIWHEAGRSDGFRQLLLPFADLRGFGNACGIAQVIQGAGGTSLVHSGVRSGNGCFP